MKAVFEWLFGSAGVILLLILLPATYLIIRRRIISRNGGTFELALRRNNSADGRGWSLGMGRYHHGVLEWYPVFSPSPRPRRSWPRNSLAIEGHRDPTEQEHIALFDDNIIVTCKSPDGPIELAMSANSLTGFASWLEAGPPGTRRGRQSL
jgi:hypothetical protein